MPVMLAPAQYVFRFVDCRRNGSCSVLLLLTLLQKAHAVGNALVHVTRMLIKISDERTASGLVFVRAAPLS